MWICNSCRKPVYFAERRQSLGYDWHPYCLKCQECGKVLNPGQHAEHKSAPYCHIPCYAALFGPQLFGHGSTTESHRSFGQRSKSFIRLETELSNKVKEYNRFYHSTPRCHLSSREVNQRLLLEGVLKVFWGTEYSIRLKEYGDNRVINRHKKALSLGFEFENIKVEDEVSEDECFPSFGECSINLPPGDLSLGFPPGELNSETGNSDLQKWETLTRLDTECNGEMDLQLLESLIEDKPIKQSSRTNLLRSQSMSVKTVQPKARSKLVDLDETNNINKISEICELNETEDGETDCDIIDSEIRELNGNLPNLVGICTQDLGSETATSKAINLESGVLDITNDESKNLKIHDLERKDLDNSDFLKSQDILENSDALDVLDVDQADTLDNIDVLDNSNVLNKSDAFEISEVNDNLKGTEDLKSNNDSLDNSNVLDSSENLPNTKIFESSEDVNNLENKENLENSKRSKMAFLMGVYTSRCNSSMEDSSSGDVKPLSRLPQTNRSKGKKTEEEEEEKKTKGPRALRRRGKKMTRLRRRSSINGHWYDRETSVFTPPKHSAMSVWATSLQSTQEVLSSLLSKYKIDSEAGSFGLYVVKESGETRLITDTEYPLLLRVNLGPHEDIAKIYLMNKDNTNEISHKVAQYLRFSYAELRSFLSMFYEEEEREADRIRFKYLMMKEVMQKRLKELEEGEITKLEK